MKNRASALLLCGLFIGGAFAFTGCKEGGQVQVYAPDGAPALVLSKLLAEDSEEDGIHYTVVPTASGNPLIESFVTGRNPQADVCVLPVNTASTQIGDGSVYQMVGLATHGNMYLISKEEKAYTRANVVELCGKKMGVVQLVNVPGLTLRSVLDEAGIMAEVQLEGVTAQQVIPTGDADLYLMPEPAATTKINAFSGQAAPFYRVGSLQELYGEEGYPQAAIVVKKSFMQSKPEKFQAIMQGLIDSQTYLATATAEEIYGGISTHMEAGAATSWKVQNLTTEIIARCNVRFEKSVDCRQKVDEFLQKLTAIDATKASTVSEEFYYIER